MNLKTKICRLCKASFVPDLYCSGDYCKKCSKINIKMINKREVKQCHKKV